MVQFFENVLDSIINNFRYLHDWRDYLDILLLSILIYQLLRITRQTRANQVLKGLGLIIVLAIIASWLQLKGIAWLLNYIIGAGFLMILIIFQPEIRRALEHVGRGNFLDTALRGSQSEQFDYKNAAGELVRATLNLSMRKVGALIVITGKTGLDDIIESGTRLDARLSAPLLESIFEPNTPLHDGAVIIRTDSILAAGCFLPSTDSKTLDRRLGTRHRAGLGLSEVSDSLVIIVSEETGVISTAYDGNLQRFMDSKALRAAIEAAYLRALGQYKRKTLFGRKRQTEQKN